MSNSTESSAASSVASKERPDIVMPSAKKRLHIVKQFTSGGAIGKSAKSSWVADVLAENGGHECVLFSYIEAIKGPGNWGRILDAGTGVHSLGWLLSLPSHGVVAVTGDSSRNSSMKKTFAGKLKPGDEIVLGNWRNDDFLKDREFDVILADYLLGALDGFAPYYQDQLLPRLARHLSDDGYLFFVGTMPLPDVCDTAAQQLIVDVKRARDAAILLAKDGRRCYREYPLDWVMRHLDLAGFMVVGLGEFNITYTARTVERQIAVGERKLRYMSPEAAAGIKAELSRLRTRVRATNWKGVVLGKDYVICAMRKKAKNKDIKKE